MRNSRCHCLLRATVALVSLLLGMPAIAQPESNTNDKIDQAVARGVAFLVNQQTPTGAINEQNNNQTAITSLSILALTAVGHQPTDKTREGEALRKALAYILKKENQDKDGYFGMDGSRMYGHGITTLMLCEMLGMGVNNEQEDLIRVACNKGINVILLAQKTPKGNDNKGGWRYERNSGDSDMSVTVWQLMALRAAKNAGIEVPKEAIDAAVNYIKQSFQKQGQMAGFGYVPNQGPTFSTAAEGLLALQVCGQYDAPEVKATSDWLLISAPSDNFFYYGLYYYAQGMYQRGEPYATRAEKVVEDSLLPKQAADGSWQASGGNENVGRTYATTMALLSLAVKFHYLPIYQR